MKTAEADICKHFVGSFIRSRVCLRLIRGWKIMRWLSFTKALPLGAQKSAHLWEPIYCFCGWLQLFLDKP